MVRKMPINTAVAGGVGREFWIYKESITQPGPPIWDF